MLNKWTCPSTQLACACLVLHYSEVKQAIGQQTYLLLKIHFSFVFGKSRFQISAWWPAIPTKVVHILPVLLQPSYVVEIFSWTGSRPLSVTLPQLDRNRFLPHSPVGSRPIFVIFLSCISAAFCHIPYWITRAFCHIS